MPISDQLAAHFPALQNAASLYIAYSGGLDSHVLLHSLVNRIGAEKITALHINHQLSPNADQWQAHCAEQCRALGVQLQAFRVTLDSDENTELAARNARYEVFEAALEEGDLLLLAHHADDQAETVLYRLMRSSGPKGLAGMPVSRPLGKGRLLRPLLSASRRDIEAYARHHKLQWVEDESNQQLNYDRNFLRHQVIPALQQRWSDAVQRLTQSAALCDEADSLNHQLAEIDMAAMDERKERLGVSITMDSLLMLDDARRKNLLRFWLQKHGYQLPSRTRLESVYIELLMAKLDAGPVIYFGDCQLRRYNQRVYLLPPMPPAPALETQLVWDGSQPLNIEGCGQLVASAPLPSTVTVGFRQGGERCQPIGRAHSQSLKKLLQEYQLEPWLRDRTPLLYGENRLLSVAGVFDCEGSSLYFDGVKITFTV